MNDSGKKSFAGFDLDSERKVLRRGGEIVSLTLKAEPNIRSPYGLAEIYASLKEKKHALNNLERAAERCRRRVRDSMCCAPNRVFRKFYAE